MTFLVWSIAAVLLSRAQSDFLPLPVDALVLLSALVLVRLDLARAGARFAALLLGYAAGSSDPIGVFLLGGGLAALVLLASRELFYWEHWVVPCGVVLLSWCCFAAAKFAAATLDLVPATPWGMDQWVGLAVTLGLAPIAFSLVRVEPVRSEAAHHPGTMDSA